MHNYESGKRWSVGIIGVRGYSGLELARCLLAHPAIEKVVGFAHDAAFAATDYLPVDEARRLDIASLTALHDYAPQCQALFLATPAEVSLEWAPRLLAAGVHVIDVSGAFRLVAGDAAQQRAIYRQWYGFEHPCPQLLEVAQYGLFPWIAQTPVGDGPQLIANPGCYATAILLALLPLLQHGVIDPDSIVIDAKSGASGAGRRAAEHLLFTEVDGDCLPYRVGRHQHLPEIRQAVQRWSGIDVAPAMATHLLPVRRGMLASIYARLAPAQDAEAVARAFANAFEGYPLVACEALPASGRAESFAVSLRRVVGTAGARIVYRVDGRRLYLFSLIDNLLKGAASQAVENFNRLFGLAPESGLLDRKGTL